jgi:hypothetical protein
LGFYYLLLIAFNSHTFQQLKVSIPRTQLGVDALPHILKITDDAHTLLFLSSIIIHASELDIVVRNSNVTGVVIEVKCAQVAGWSVDNALTLVQCSTFLPLFTYFGHCSLLHLTLTFTLTAGLSFCSLHVTLCLFFLNLLLALLLVLGAGIIDHFYIVDGEISQSN